MSFIKNVFSKPASVKKNIDAIFAFEIMGQEDEVFIFHRGVRYLLLVNRNGGLSLRK